jgi:hypothetical protein
MLDRAGEERALHSCNPLPVHLTFAQSREGASEHLRTLAVAVSGMNVGSTTTTRCSSRLLGSRIKLSSSPLLVFLSQTDPLVFHSKPLIKNHLQWPSHHGIDRRRTVILE